MTDDHLAVLARRTDWDDLEAVGDRSRSVFRQLVHEGGLVAALEGLRHDEHLRGMCERYDFLDKLVLFDDPDTSVRVRLHLFRSGYYDRPHNHRWSFASRIVRGKYVHRLYGREDVLLGRGEDDPLEPIMERVERPDDEYVLHHNSVHSVQAEEDTISLVLRGPAAKDRFLIRDRDAGSFWVKGAASESEQERARKVMAPDLVDSTIDRIRGLLASG